MIELFEPIGTPVSLTDDNTVVDEVADRWEEKTIDFHQDQTIDSFFSLIVQVRDEYRNDYDPGRGGFGKRHNPGMETDKIGMI